MWQAERGGEADDGIGEGWGRCRLSASSTAVHIGVIEGDTELDRPKRAKQTEGSHPGVVRTDTGRFMQESFDRRVSSLVKAICIREWMHMHVREHSHKYDEVLNPE